MLFYGEFLHTSSLILSELFTAITSTAWFRMDLSLLLRRSWSQVLLRPVGEVRGRTSVLNKLRLSHTELASFKLLLAWRVDARADCTVDKVVVGLQWATLVVLLLPRG